MVDWNKVHVGKHRQAISQEEAAAQKEAGLIPGMTPDLHAPEIANPAERPEMHLHGDVAGSPYSANPGEISLKEAAERDAANREPPARAARDTRAREAESRRTGTPTETLAAEDEAAGTAPTPPSTGAP